MIGLEREERRAPIVTGRLPMSSTHRAIAISCCLALAAACSPSSSPAAAANAAPASSAPAESDFTAERARYEARIAELQTQLDRATMERVQREQEWQTYTRGIAKLGVLAQRSVPDFAAQIPPDAANAAAADETASDAVTDDAESAPRASSTEDDARAAEAKRVAEARHTAELRAQRDAQIALALKSLFTVERVLGFELLESGALENGATGPVVLRVHDELGRPIGALCAERLRLEASHAARTVTLVLEDGYERLGVEKTPFPGADRSADGTHGGEKRIELAGVDPKAWVTALPELFGKTTDPLADDGRWNLSRLRTEINLLLREDASAGYWRLADFGGVRGETLLDVMLEELDSAGRRVRTLFADRMTIDAEAKGLCLSLESGAQQKGDKKIPFLEGRFRVYLPSADVARWRARGVPGLSEPPSDSIPAK